MIWTNKFHNLDEHKFEAYCQCLPYRQIYHVELFPVCQIVTYLQELISSYPTDDTAKVKKIAESINQRCLLIGQWKTEIFQILKTTFLY